MATTRSENVSGLNPHVFNTFSSSKFSREENLAYIFSLLDAYQKNLPSKLEALEQLLSLPDEYLIYSIVEIDLMEREGGWVPYEDREPGCIAAVIKGFCEQYKRNRKALDETGILLTHSTVTNPQNVKNELIETKTSGHYRPTDRIEAVTIDSYSISPKGLLFLLNPSEHLQSLKIFKLSEVEKYKKFNLQLQTIINLLNKIRKKEITNLQEFKQRANKKLHKHSTTLDLSVLNDNDAINLIKRLLQNKNSDVFDPLLDALRNAKTEDETFTCLQALASVPTSQFIDFLYIERSLNPKNPLQHMQGKDKELRSIILSDPEKFITELSNNHDGIIIQAPSTIESTHLMQLLISELNPNKDTNEAWLSFIQTALLVHPFCDANNRVFLNIIFNGDTLQKFALLPIFHNPFVFYAHEPNEVRLAYSLACANYLAMIDARKNNNPRGFEFNSNLVTAKEKQTLNDAQLKELESKRAKYLESAMQPLREMIQIEILIEKIKLKFAPILSTEIQPTLFKGENELQKKLHADLEKLSHCETLASAIVIMQKASLEYEKSFPEVAKFYAQLQSEFKHLPSAAQRLNAT